MDAVTRGDGPLVFATVGTDHHPFDRLVRWLDGWLESREDDRVRCLVQTGTSMQPQRASSREYLDYETMKALLRDAAVVVCHGGPATIMLCAYAGNRPIVVPRVHRLGEHVDDHQVVFTRRMAREGTIELAETEDRFRELLDDALYAGAAVRVAGATSSIAEAVQRFEEAVADLPLTRELRSRARV